MKLLTTFKIVLLFQFGTVLTLFTFFSLKGTQTISLWKILLFVLLMALAYFCLYRAEQSYQKNEKITLINIIIPMIVSFNLLNFTLGILSLIKIRKYNKEILSLPMKN